MRIYLTTLLFFFWAFSSLAQSTSTTGTKTTNTTAKNNFIQISGIVMVDEDSILGIPFASIVIKGTNRQTVCDYYGFFTIVAQPGDELLFFSMSHKPASRKLEDTLSLKHYYIIQRLVQDTIQLATVPVYPWPSKEEIKKAFLNLDLTENDLDRAAKNLDRSTASYSERNMQMDAQANYQFAMKQYLTKVYSAGQYPTISLLNPIAWAQFFDALKKGKFKTKNSKKSQ